MIREGWHGICNSETLAVVVFMRMASGNSSWCEDRNGEGWPRVREGGVTDPFWAITAPVFAPSRATAKQDPSPLLFGHPHSLKNFAFIFDHLSLN